MSVAALALPAPEGLALWQPIYEAAGIHIFPVRADKRPMISGFLKTGRSHSRAYARRNPTTAAFGFCPAAAGVTVLDIDSDDPVFVRRLFERFGQPRIVIRTASGKVHGYYRHNGEGRRTRPNGEPFDILGTDGFVIAPGSVLPTGEYTFVTGGLETLGDLQPMREASNFIAPRPVNDDGGKLKEGDGRNGALLRHLGPHARSCDSLDDLIDVANHFAEENFADAMPAEIGRAHV